MSRDGYRLHWIPDCVAFDRDQLRDWLFRARAGERCLYHIGQMLIDQEDRPTLRLMGDYAALMAEFGVILLNQKRVAAGLYQYFASRTSVQVRSVPRAVASGDVEIRLFLSLRAIHTRAPDVSARRAVRDALSCSEHASQEVLDSMMAAGLLSPGRPPTITDAGMMVIT